MNIKMKDKGNAFYLVAVSGILSLVAIFLYATAMYRIPVIFILLSLAVVLTVTMVIYGLMKGTDNFLNLIPVLNALLNINALAWSLTAMINQIGYVIAALDPVSTIMTYIVYLGVVFIAFALNLVASYRSIVKR